jgi:hypothetical protein
MLHQYHIILRSFTLLLQSKVLVGLDIATNGVIQVCRHEVFDRKTKNSVVEMNIGCILLRRVIYLQHVTTKMIYLFEMF